MKAPVSMKRPLHALYLQTTPARQEESVDALMRIIARTFPDADARLLIVDNALDSPCERHVAPNVTLIDGDNRGREFTGLDRGIAWLRSKSGSRGESSSPAVAAARAASLSSTDP